MAKLIFNGNELSIKYPELAKEWDYENNYPVTPDDVASRSNIKFWWICKNGHHYESTPDHRLRGSGCPICGNKKVLVGYNDLATTHPDIAKEWHPTKNGNITPTQIVAGSNTKVWWLCSTCGDEWEQSPNVRTSARCDCPTCAGRKIKIGYNDLATVCPELLKEWHPTKNGNLKPTMVTRGSHKKVWWICNKAHEWEASPHNRSKGNGCPICGAEKAHKTQRLNSAKANNFAEKYPELLKEWDYYKNEENPNNYAVKSNFYVWWKCPDCGHSWKASIADRTTNNYGCPKCNLGGTSFSEQAIFYYIQSYYPATLNRYKNNKIEFDVFIPDNQTAIEYDGKYYHGQKNSLLKENRKDDYCRANHIRLIRIRDSSLPITNYAEIISCEDANFKSLETAIQELLLKLQINIAVNIEKDTSKILANYRKRSQENSFASLFPNRAKEWNYEKNYPLTPDKVSAHSNHKVWWKCKKGHEWQAIIGNRIKGDSKCPYCSNRKVLIGFNDLATTHPELANEWHYEKNTIKPTEVVAGSNKKVWWKCSKCGYEWETQIENRASGSGCIQCSREKQGQTWTKKSAQKNNFAIKFPEIAKEWHPTKNGDLKPNDFSSSSNQKVWWKCNTCGNEWKTQICCRTAPQGTNCPVCSIAKRVKSKSRNIVLSKGSIVDKYPEIINQWHTTKNRDLKPENFAITSNKHVWWVCEKGHEWETSIYDRVGKGSISKCPYCYNLRVWKGYNDLESQYPEIAKEWNYERNDSTPDMYVYGSNKKVWWKCSKCGYEWERAINMLTKKKDNSNYCPKCAKANKMHE